MKTVYGYLQEQKDFSQASHVLGTTFVN